MTNPVDPPLTPSAAPRTASADSAPQKPLPKNQAPPGWLVLSVVAAGMLAGAVMVVLLKPGATDASAAARASAPAKMSDAAARTSAATRDVERPKWSGGVRRSNGRNVAVYELPAENDIALWNRVVRPVLTVRCIAGTTEVFVLTQSAAAIDGNDGRHAVRVGYDGEADGSERWMASDEYDALFAENGVGAARRIAAARTMRFGFTPYNAAPVIATFEVAGFDAVASRLAKTCRW